MGARVSDPAGEDECRAAAMLKDGTDLDFGVAGARLKFKEVARLGIVLGFANNCDCCLAGAHLLVSSPRWVPTIMDAWPLRRTIRSKGSANERVSE